MPKTVLVTGAAGGIGCALIDHLSSSGWSVIGTDFPGTFPDSFYSDKCLSWVSADLTRLYNEPSYLASFVDSLSEVTCGSDIYGIVHNAAVQHVDNFLSLSNEVWHETFVVNLLSTIVITRALFPQLERQRGSLVHIGSIHNSLTKPGFTAYATSKSALAGLTRSMAVELGDRVRVNSVEPAAISTPMLINGFIDNSSMLAELNAFHPTGSIGNPSEVARAVLFLLDPSNSFLNGCTISLSGGIHNRLHDPI